MRCSGLIILAVLAAGLVGGCARKGDATAAAPAVPSNLRKIVLQTDWFPQAEHGGYYQALARGFFRQAGLEVEIWPGGPGAGIKLKVGRGDAEFGMDRSDDIILAASVGMPLLIVAATMQHDPQALMVHAASPVKTFADLDGRVVIGHVGMAYFPYLEKRFGIKIERRPNTYGLGEFLANPDVIQQCLMTNEPFFAAQHGREVRTLPLASSGYDCYPAVFTRRDFARSSPDVVRAFVRAAIEGWRDYLEHDPAPANALILARNPQMTSALLDFSRGEMIRHRFVAGDPVRKESIGRISLARLQEQIDTLRELKILTEPLSLENVATTEFLPTRP